MKNDYLEEAQELIKKYKKEDIVYGKDINFLLNRIKVSKEEIEKEILNCNNLFYTDKQIKGEEIRYVLLFKYSRKRGRRYVITFRDNNIRIITIFPIGRKTLKKYRKKGLNI